MVKVFVRDGTGSTAQQMPVVKVNGVEMPLDQAELALLAMTMTARCAAVTMHDARKLQQQKGFMLTDGVGGTLTFLGTVAEWQGQTTKVIIPSWRAPSPRYADAH